MYTAAAYEVFSGIWTVYGIESLMQVIQFGAVVTVR